MSYSTPARDFVLSIYPNASIQDCRWSRWAVRDSDGTNLSLRWKRGIYRDDPYPAECYAWEDAALNIKEELLRKLER